MVWSATAGYFACFICAIFFGSMFVPLKRVNTGDGMFVQWVMCCAIFCTGLVVGAFDAYANFYPLSMIGGFLWATGNITAIPIINRIGMTVGILLWSFTGLLSGWASGRFGWFGMNPQKPENPTLNYVGLILSLFSTVMFAFVKNSPRSQQEIFSGTEERDELLDNDVIVRSENSNVGPIENQSNLLYRQHQRFFEFFYHFLSAIFAAIIAGLFYGLCFVPVIYIQDNVPHSPKEALCFVFAFSCGVFATSTFYFLVYTAYKGNQPFMDPKSVVPAFLAGIFWAIAQTAFFVANEALSEAVSFPIVSRFPGLIAALWGVFVFKEIQGRKNLILLTAAMVVTVIGGILCGLSRGF